MKRAATQLLWLIGGIAVAVALSLVWFTVLKPRQALPPKPWTEEPDYDSISKDLTAATIQDDLDTYLAHGSRFTGSKAFREVGDALIEQFRKLGYRVIIQEHEVVVPETVYCRLLDENGKPVPGVEIHPYYPNRFRTATTPPGGITGTVVFKGDPSGDDKVQALDQCMGNIIMLRVRERFQDYANFGARAVFYYNDRAKDTKAWQFRRKESHCSIDVPVFFVDGEDVKSVLVGKKVTVQARVDWKRIRVRNILAVMDPEPGRDKDRETLLITAYYDTWSSIPDLAPGARQTLSLQTMMYLARRFAEPSIRSRFRRRIVFFAAAGRGQASAGSRHLLAALGPEPEPQETLKKADERRKEIQKDLDILLALQPLIPEYFARVRDRASHRKFWRGRRKIEKAFRDELSFVLEQRATQVDDEALEARTAWVRAGSKKGPELTAFLKANKKAQVYRSLAHAKPYVLAAGGGYRKYFEIGNAGAAPSAGAKGNVIRPAMDEPTFDAYLEEQIERLKDRVAERIARDRFYLRQLDQNREVFQAIRGEDGRRRVLGIEINFSDKSKHLVLASGGWWWSSRCVPADREVALQFRYAQEKLNPLVQEEERFVSMTTRGDAWACGFWYLSPSYLHSTKMVFNRYTSFVLINKGDDREYFATPLDTPDTIKWANVVDIERLIAAGVERLAYGRGKILPIGMPLWSQDFSGLVTSVKGTSLVPNHPEPGALVQLIGTFWTPRSWLHYTNGGGYYTAHMDPYPLVMSDELGRYTFEQYFAHRWWKVTFHAARTDPETGNITWIKDLGYEQKYPTERLRVFQVPELVRIVLFRCTPVQIFKAENPQKMKLYDKVQARLVRGFAGPKRYYSEQFYAGEYVLYLEPDTVFYPVFLSGAPHNPSLLRIAGICLNISPEEFERGVSPDEPEVSGPGYLAADVRFLYHPEDDLARSMATINQRRVERYKRYNLLDEPTLKAAEKARRLAIEGARLRKEGRHYLAFQTMKDSLAYSTNIHPVIRDAKSQAVYGIIFYLLLLIPFAFFMEKLLFGHPDIRIQVLLVGAIFLVVFFILRAVHPAFLIVRSSFMILLGFITLVLSLMVTWFVGTKFRAAVMEYQKFVHGRQVVAEVTKAAAAFTGFLLGINNMRKRKVRTALTAVTLILITFVMICFTAVENDYIEVEYPIGRAPYTGIEIRKNTLGHLGTQTTVLVNAFENDYDVAVRRWDVAGLWGIMPVNKNLEAETYISPEEVDNLPVPMVRTVDGKTLKWTARGSLGLGTGPAFDPNEFLLVKDRWFKTESEKSCILPLPAARKLGITPEMVEKGNPPPTVRIAGRDLVVINLFDPDKLEACRTRDGKPVTPVDLEAKKRLDEQKEKEAGEKAAAEKKAKEKEKKEAAESAGSGKTGGANGKTNAGAGEKTKAGSAAGSSGNEAESGESEEKKEEEPRLPAAGIVLFPTQRQPKPETLVSHFKGKLRVNQKEPINFDRMFITHVPPVPEDTRHKHYWFRDDDPQTCFIPARMASELKITPEMVEKGNARIKVQGTILTVKGIYDGAAFDQIHDLDQESLAPYDVESIVGRPREDAFEEDEMPEAIKRLSGSDIIICNDRSTTHGWHVASIAIDLSKLGSHKRVREVLDRYLEKTGSKAFYGIGDTAYFGARFRRPHGGNWLELFVPLLIASLTVLNTMRGSVYERRDEIYVYNAVGLNPFHVFFLFIAEACVYAVVGAMGGYLLANFTGTVLHLLGWDAGLTINYSSIYAVMYSIVIMAAVLLSTWFPARAAARLAAPAEQMKWTVPDPEGDEIAFQLPFTFGSRDRVAIVAYFAGWFDEFGEGSSGKFFASGIRCGMERFHGRPAAALHVTTWLRPYDLGVSQEVIMRFYEDPDTGMTVAHLTLKHLSGDVPSWVRTNYLFLKLLRKHFLDWRMVPDDEKEDFLHRARRLLAPPEMMEEQTAATG